MHPIASYILIAVAIGLVIASFILRVCKQKTVGNILELTGIACFVAFASQYAHWFFDMASIDDRGIAELLLFIFSVVVGVYRLVFFVFLPKR